MMKPLDLTPDAPWKQRFRATNISWSAVAANNPQRGLVCTNKDGIYQLYAWNVPTNELTQVTHLPAGLINGWLSANGQYIYYHQDEKGNEIGHFMRVPFAGGTAEDVTPDMPPYSSWYIGENKTGALLGFLATGPDGFVVYVQGDEPTPRRLYHSSHLASGPYFSADGRLAAVYHTEHAGGLMDGSIEVLDVATGDSVAALWDGDEINISPVAFSPVLGDERLLAASSRTGYERPLVWHPRTDERRDLSLDDLLGSVTPWGWSADGQRLLLCQLHQAQYQLYVYHLTEDHLIKLDHPAGVWSSGYFTAEGTIIATWQNPATPGQVVALDAQTGQLERVLLRAGDTPTGQSWRSISFVGANDEMIQGWLATPSDEGPFPTILHTHGGPTSVISESFFPVCQAWLDHGFAFLSINYHGSTTFGKAFERSIWGNLGDLEVEDMTAAYHWLVAQGIAQPEAVLLTGSSYGGYLTLQALGKQPEFWAGGMAQIAIADWGVMYEDQAETLRGYQRALFGGAPDEVPEAIRKSSPITYAEAIEAPILVIQGSNDTRCPARQMRLYEQKLQELGKSIQIHWFEAGHGSRDQEQHIEHQELMLRFAYRVLG